MRACVKPIAVRNLRKRGPISSFSLLLTVYLLRYVRNIYNIYKKTGELFTYFTKIPNWLQVLMDFA